jgi:hypothetical protein
MIWLFAKKVKLLDTNNLETLHAKVKILKDAGIRSNTWSTQEPPVLGGAHMKTSDWQGVKDHNKDDERVVYHLEVAEADQYRAMKLLMGGAAQDGNFTK